MEIELTYAKYAGRKGANPDVDLGKLKKRQLEHLQQFEERASSRNFLAIHNGHYDWWMFPNDKKSSFQYRYSVFADDIKRLKGDDEYMISFRRGIELLLLAWGWDLYKERFVDNPADGQEWQHYPIRLYKVALSAVQFEQKDITNSLRRFAALVLERDEKARISDPEMNALRVKKVLRLVGCEDESTPPDRY